MGGAYEDTIETKPKIAGSTVIEGEVSGIRYHLVGGTVHFHDKAKPLQKVEVPISDWLKGWELLRNPRELVAGSKTTSLVGRFTYSNIDRGTLLLGQSTITMTKGKDTTEFSLQIVPVTFDPAWVALEEFRNKGR